jgi:hypothetical protein
LLAGELPNRVGSPLSIKNLKELLQVAHESVERWIKIFERMYFCFRVPPYGSRNIRAVKKEQKLYLWDWSILFYFMEMTQIPKFYQVHMGKKDYEKNGVRVLPVQKFIKELSLP